MSIWKLSASAEKDAQILRNLLHKPPLLGGAKKICTLIERLSATDEPAAIPSVASGLFSSSETIHNAASSGIAKLLNLVPTIELIRLSEFLGGYFYGYVYERRDRIKPRQVEAYLKKTSDIAVGSLLSLHKNGYVRQIAVRFLSDVDSGEEIRFLLLRQNDWVDSISETAQSAICDRLTGDNLVSFVSESDLLMHLLECKRRDLSKIVSLYIDLLIAPQHREHVNEAVNSCGKQTGRKLIGLLLCRDGDHLADVVQFGVSSHDGVVRSKCLRRASDCLPADVCTEIAERFLSDKFIPVRLEAYELSAASSPAMSTGIWKRGLFDKSRSLRETAMFYLKKDGCDVASIYRKHLSRFPNSLPALSGLVESGDEKDIALFFQCLASPYASRRAEAVRGLGRFDRKSDVGRIQQSLLDESARVVRAAHQQLSTTRNQLNPEHLFGLIDDCKNLAGKKAILHLLLGLGRWPALSFLIRAAANEDALVADYSRSLIDASFCMNRVFTQPSSEQKKQIQTAIDESANDLANSVILDLRSYLSSYGFSV
ncbi:HEAT repeat domain-containing protein [Neorhodopirellula pilleata]|uniref:HEAT repeat protein n=1 Tax=Neorhodopirellula pilleata TaxID=2714738 RepID=A0A5C5ZVJ0_9BACT|nr:hypothetical protein [Neorhodopirellula pilleata]TWT91186.1 hypothetical protein Pla100_53600 [Neorhodopirellula pilleata]